MNEESKQEPPREKRPYHRPRILESAAFETLALSCGKDQVDRTGTCNGGQVGAS